MRSALLTISFSTLALICAPTAQAALMLEFSENNGTSFDTDFSLFTGDTITLEVYLTDSDAGGVLNTDGLLGFGLVGNRSSGAGTISSDTIDPTFDFNINGSTTTMIDWDAATFAGPIPTGTQILLGEFDFTATVVGVTAFDFNDRVQGSGSAAANWESGANVTLDETIFGAGATFTFPLTFTASAVAVPEPSSAAVLGMLGCGSFCRRSRRKSGPGVA